MRRSQRLFMIDQIETPNFTLRRLAESDRGEFVRVHEISQEHFRPWAPTSLFEGTLTERFDEELRRCADGWNKGDEIRLTAELPNGRLAGFFALSQIVRGPFQNAYAGWRVSVDRVGRGLAATGVAALLDLAFAPPPQGLGLQRVQANVIPENAASVRVAEKAGFRVEGLARAYLEIDGRRRDHLMFAKLAGEHVFTFLAPVRPR